MKYGIAIVLSLQALFCAAQVQLDGPLEFTGPIGTRAVIGLGDPIIDRAVVNISVLSSGQGNWATGSWSADTLLLVLQPTVSGLDNGLLIRFIPGSENQGRSWVRLPGLPSHELLRDDGLSTSFGALRGGEIAEIIFIQDHWILMNASADRCPPGTLAVNERLCMDANATPGLLYYPAVDRCAARGGKLCTWDEYVAGCFILGAQLNGMFDAWEWIDDSSNHTHTSNQAGRFSCSSQRSINVITTFLGDTRCCYHPR